MLIAYLTLRTTHSPDALLGRVGSTARVVSIGLTPVGLLAGGLLIDATNGATAIAAMGIWMLALTAGFGASRDRPRRSLTGQPGGRLGRFAQAASSGRPNRSPCPNPMPQAGQHVGLGAGLHAFGDEPAAGLGGEVLEARGQRLAEVVAVDPVDEADVELGVGRPELEDVAQAGVPGAGVVDRQPDVAELAEGRAGRAGSRRSARARSARGRAADARP